MWKQSDFFHQLNSISSGIIVILIIQILEYINEPWVSREWLRATQLIMVVTDKNWQCPICNFRSSRRWNMVRHIKLRHNSSLFPVMPEGVARDSYIRQGFPPKLDNGNILYNTGPDRSGDPLTELLEWMQNYYISIKSFASTHTPPVVPPSTHTPPVVPPSTHTPPVAPPSTPFYPEQVQNTSSNYWKMPITDIRGVSGYFCKSCNIFSLRLIRDIGCDMTEKRKHMGLQDLIDIDAPLDSIPVTSLRKCSEFHYAWN